LPGQLTIDEAAKRDLAAKKAREEALKPKPPVKVVAPAKVLDQELKKVANKQAAQADKQRGYPETQTQRRAKVKGYYEYEVQNARKQMGIKEGSPEDDLLKSAVYMAIIDDPDKPAYQKIVDPALLKRNLNLLKSNPAQIEKERQVYRAQQKHRAENPLPELAATPQDQVVADRRRVALENTPGIGLTLQESDRVRGNIKSGLDKVMPGSVVNDFLASLMNPLQAAETIAYGVGSAQQIGQGNQDFKAGDVVGPAVETILTVAGAGASKIGLKTIRELGELGDVAKATQKLIDSGVEANQARKAAETIVEAKQAGKLDDVLADPRIAKFNDAQAVPDTGLPKRPPPGTLPTQNTTEVANKAASSSLAPWQMTRDEIALRPEFRLVEDAGMTLARRKGGVTEVTPKFFDLPPEDRKWLLIHEDGHDMIKPSEGLDRWRDVIEPFRINKEATRYSTASRYENPFGIRTEPEEMLADGYRSLFETELRTALPDGSLAPVYKPGSPKDLLRKEIAKQALKDGKPVPADVLNDYPDLANLKADIPGAGNNAVPNVPGKKESVRFETGKKLTKTEREQVLSKIGDSYDDLGAPQVFKGLSKNDEEMYGFQYDANYMHTSDITGAKIRHYVTLPDGRIAHPSELFPDITQGNVVSLAKSQKEVAKRAAENAKASSARLNSIIDNLESDNLQDALKNLSATDLGKPNLSGDVPKMSWYFNGETGKLVYAPTESALPDALKARGFKQVDDVSSLVDDAGKANKRTPVIPAKPAVETPPKSPQLTETPTPKSVKPLGPGAQRITKARVNEYRQSLGLPETAPGKRPWNVEIEKAVNEGFVDKALDTARELEVKSRPLETHEQLAFGIKLQELDDELINVQKQLADAVDSGDEAAIIQAKLAQQDLQNDIDTMTLVLNKSGGTDVARSLASRRAYINARLEQPRAYAVAQVGRKLDPTESAKIDELVSEIERLKNEVKSGPATRLKTELAPRVASRRKIDVSIEKATADYNAAKARAAQASKQISGKGKRGGAVNPFLFDVAYHGAKLQLLKGVRVLDDIIKAIRADVPDADENDILQAIDQAEKDLRVTGKPRTKPNITTLRKEVADALESANPESVSYYQQIQDDLDRVLKQGPPYGESLEELADRVGRAKRSFAQGSGYGWDVVARGQNAMQDPDFIKLRGQLKQADARLQSEVKNIVEKDRRATLSKGQKVTENLVGGLMNSRQLLTGPDTSFGLRQGMSAILQGHYLEGYNMIKRGIQSFGSTDKFNDIDAMVRGSRRYDEAVTAGLDLTDFTAGQVEEDALAGLLGKNVNVKGKNVNPYAASNRAYTASANSIRLDVYTKLADALEKPGKSLTGEEATLLADFVNTMSGRTSWLKNSGKFTKVLNGVAFAPKYALSRIEFLSGAPLAKAIKLGKQSGDMRLATTIGKEYMKFYGSVGAMLTVLNFAKEQGLVDGDLDPRSSKFGKVGIKNENGTTTYFDLTGGYGSYFTTAYRVAAGLTRAVQGALGVDEPVKPIKNQKGDYTDNLGYALSGVAKGKTSPAVRTTLSALLDYNPETGNIKDFGQEKNLPQLAGGMVTPISLQTAFEGASDRQQLNPIENFRNFAWEFFGLGNQTTDLPKVTSKRPPP